MKIVGILKRLFFTGKHPSVLERGVLPKRSQFPQIRQIKAFETDNHYTHPTGAVYFDYDFCISCDNAINKHREEMGFEKITPDYFNSRLPVKI